MNNQDIVAQAIAAGARTRPEIIAATGMADQRVREAREGFMVTITEPSAFDGV